MRVDTVVAATGYDRGLRPIVGHLGVLDGLGRPVGARPGLHFIGYDLPVSGQLPALPGRARRIARAVVRADGSRRTSTP